MTIPFQTEWNNLIPFQLEWIGHSIPDGMAIPIRPDWNATLLIILRNMLPVPLTNKLVDFIKFGWRNSRFISNKVKFNPKTNEHLSRWTQMIGCLG